MKKYLAIFLGSTNGNIMEAWKNQPEEERKAKEKAGIEAWGKWTGEHKAEIVDIGSPLGKTKRTDKGGVSDTKNAMSAWTVVQAASHEEAAKMFENHPHFTMFPGESVEVMEMLAMPEMPKQ